MTPGDMPDFEPAVGMAYKAFANLTDAAVKHMIIISDGDPAAPSGTLISPDEVAGSDHLDRGGRPPTGRRKAATLPTSPRPPAASSTRSTIPTPCRGFISARPAASPGRWSSRTSGAFSLQTRTPHEIISGIDALPPITGFVLTSRKENPLVETVLVSPQPAGEDNNTILAAWPYGLGKAVAFTSDDGARWTKQWPDRVVLRQAFRADHPLGDAAGRRQRQIHHGHGSR